MASIYALALAKIISTLMALPWNKESPDLTFTKASPMESFPFEIELIL